MWQASYAPRSATSSIDDGTRRYLQKGTVGGAVARANHDEGRYLLGTAQPFLVRDESLDQHLVLHLSFQESIESVSELQILIVSHWIAF